MLEAQLYALGCAAGETLDLNNLLRKMLSEESISTYPFLLGRSFWLAGRCPGRLQSDIVER